MSIHLFVGPSLPLIHYSSKIDEQNFMNPILTHSHYTTLIALSEKLFMQCFAVYDSVIEIASSFLKLNENTLPHALWVGWEMVSQVWYVSLNMAYIDKFSLYILIVDETL